MQQHTTERPKQNEQRERNDRRQNHSMWNSLRFYGRREGARRWGEGQDTYVDRPRRRVTTLVYIITICSILDALLTLLYIERGGSEANPVMNLAINYGNATFVGIKMALTVLGVSFLALHQNFRSGLLSLYAMAGVYLLLLVYHGILWLGEL